MKETTKTVYFKTWSEGWWTIDPHTKITIKSDCPTNQSIFYYAKTTDGTGLWEGSPNEYGGGIPDYFRIKLGEAFRIENPKFDPNVKYPANYWKIFRKKDITKGGLFSKPSVNIYLTL